MMAEAWITSPPTKAGIDALRYLSGDKSSPWPKRRQDREKVLRGLIARGLIEVVGWNLTDAGYRAIGMTQIGEARS